MKPFALTLSLTLAWMGSTTLAQTPTENPPTVPADSTPKPPPKAATKTDKKAAKNGTKVAKKEEPKGEEQKPLTPGPAVVKEKNVNVRGKAAINSEVVSHLKRGDHIQVLEEVTIKAKADEPAKWAKIALPTNAPVWVHASFVDAATKTVSAKKLNLRGGPGENYSVIGQVTKGTVVKDIESKGDWMRIEPPANCFAYVAAHLIANEAAPPIAIASTTVPPKPPVVIAATAPPAPPVTETTVAAANPPVVGAEPVATPPATVVSPPATATPAPAPPIAVAAAPPPTIGRSPEPATPAGPAQPEPEEDVKRVVTREGIVKRSVSIQAPTYFVLENRDGKTINYLYSPSTNLVLKDFYGKLVMVSGEESLDERWPNRPVIAIDKLETVP